MVGVIQPPTIQLSSISVFSTDTRKPTKLLKKLPQISANKNSQKIAEFSKNPYVWNTKIRAQIENNQHDQALCLYLSMVKEGIPPDEFTFPLVFKSCSSLKRIKEGKQIHTQVVKHGIFISQDVFVQNSILYMYASCGLIDTARNLFDKMTERTLVSWNSMIAGYSKSFSLELEAVLLYVLMLKGRIVPDGFSFTVLFRACASVFAVKEAIQIHSHVIKLGFHSNPLVNNSLIDMYVKFGLPDAALLLFNSTNERSLVSSNALVTGFIRQNDLDSAKALFDNMDVKNVVSWNIMISGYVQNGLLNEAFDFFQRMQLEGTSPNSITIVSILSACSESGSLSIGKWVHLYCERQDLVGSNEIVKAALVKMYSKCGDVDSGYRVFESMVKRDVVSWDVMIEGFALNGQGEEALDFFQKMLKEGVKPDKITFIGVLNACRHAGFVEEGLKHFRSMKSEFGIDPNQEHYACVVDLLGRAGRLYDALEVIEDMTISRDAVVWNALLGSCRKHNDVLLAEYVVNRIMGFDSKCSSNYVLMSNIYAARNQWDEVAKMRKMMKTKETEKERGCSLIEIEGIVNKFSTGNLSHHTQFREIYEKLEELMNRIKAKGYVPDKDSMLLNIEQQEEKEKSLNFHSEKLAVAFGILRTPPGSKIRIMNNLRMCKDCHSAMKFISQIEEREIIVRDRNRFHHFKNGLCSCGNYW